jgi:uncharacterized SAM-binding protein YcdF (DUF218 family)
MTYVEPLLAVVVIIGFLGAVWHHSRKGRWFGAAALALLIAISWPPLDWLFSRLLEAGYPRYGKPSEPADAIVVFGSSFDQLRKGHPITVPDREGFERCEYAAWLYREWRQVPVLACGGRTRGQSVGSLTADLISRAGVPRSAILTEEKSLSTHENAVFAADILRSLKIRKVALVIDARSMPRAAACLRHAGMEVVPAACAFTDPPANFDDWIPGWSAVRLNEITMHEVLGLAWYKLHGWI